MTAPFGIVNVGMMLITIFYFAIAFYGYLRFGPESLASITLNLPHDSIYGSIKVMLSVALLASFAIQFVVGHEIFFGPVKKWISKPAHTDRWDYICRVVFTTFTVIIAIGIPHLGPITSFVGAMFGIPLTIVIPVLMDLLHRLPRRGKLGRCKWRLVVDVILLIAGIFFTVVGAITSINAIILS